MTNRHAHYQHRNDPRGKLKTIIFTKRWHIFSTAKTTITVLMKYSLLGQKFFKHQTAQLLF